MKNRLLKLINNSLQGRLESWLLLPLLVLFVSSGGVSYALTRYYADQVYDSWLYDSANSLAQQVRLTGGRAALDLPQVAQEMFQWDDDDQTLYRVVGSKTGHIAGVLDGPTRAQGGTRFRNALLFDQAIRGQAMRWAAVELALEPMGERVIVMVGETTRKRGQLAREILWSVWTAQFVLLALVAWLIHRVIFSQTRKLHVLSAALLERSHRDLRPVPAADMPRELRPLVDALNDVIAKLDKSASAQRSFIANAAHQLRTPLTALNLQAEAAEHCPDLTQTRQSIRQLQHATQRAVRLANQLLLLSRAEPDAQSASLREQLDLRTLVFEAAREWGPQALAKNIEFAFDDLSESVGVWVDAALVREAVNNLLDNALKYCPAGTQILVSTQRSPEPCLTVEDSGPGIEPAERSRALQRFYRGDGVRTEGSGLGLAIIQEIANAHAGRVLLSASALGGLKCQIFFRADALPTE